MSHHPDQLVKQTEGIRLLGISRTTAWRRMTTDPEFPPRIKIGPDRFGFRLSDLERYIATRPAAPLAPTPMHMVEGRRRHARERRKVTL